MQIEQIIYLLKAAYVDLEMIKFKNKVGSMYESENLPALKSLIKNLRASGLYSKEVETIEKINVENHTGNIVNLASEDFQNLTSIFVTLSASLRPVIAALEKIAPPKKANSIYVKFPNVNDFQQLSKYSDTFQMILSQVIVNETIGGEIKIEGVENGSIVTKISVGTIAAVNLIGGLTWGAAVVYKTIMEGKEKEQIVKQRIIQNNHAIDVAHFYKSLAKLVAEDEATHLYNEHFKGKAHDPEQIKRIQHSMELLSQELSKGAEIIPAIESTPDIIKSFPDMGKLPLLESKINKIENNR